MRGDKQDKGAIRHHGLKQGILLFRDCMKTVTAKILMLK